MKEIARFIVPIDLNDANPNRVHKLRQKMRVKKLHRETAHMAWIAAGKPTSAIPVTLSIIVRHGRTMDVGNCWAAMKYCIDGIFKDALTKDDNAKWLSLGTVQQETGAKYKLKPSVEIIVTSEEV